MPVRPSVQTTGAPIRSLKEADPTMRLVLRSALACLACAILSAAATAQYRKTADLMYTLGSSLAGEMRSLSGQKPIDEAKMFACANRIKEASQNAARALSGFGEPLANAAKSPHESTLNEPLKAAKLLIYQLDRDLPQKCESVTKLINTDVNSRGSGFPDTLAAESLGLAIMAEARYKEWQTYADLCDKTRRWLADSLKNATNDRDRATQDSRPIEEAQTAAWVRLKAAKDTEERADTEHDRGVERVAAAEAREDDAYARWRDAVSRGAQSEETWAMRQRWAQAANEEYDALVAAITLFQTLNAAREEVSRAYVQLAAAQKQMREFTVVADANKVVEQFNNFTQWLDLFERDLNR